VTNRLIPAFTAVGALFLSGLGVALVFGLLAGGGAEPLLLVDPGPTVRWGIPLAKAFVHLGAALAVGALMVAAFVLSRKAKAFSLALVVAACGAGLMTVASGTSAFFTFMAIYVEPVSIDQQFGDLLWLYLQSTEIGRSWLITMGLSAIVTVLSVVVRSFGGVFAAGVLSVAALWPLAEQGHAAGTANHEAAVSASYAHSVFAAMWVGGLAVMAIIAWSEKPSASQLHGMLQRYSTIALVSFIVVAVSGLTNAWLRVGTLAELASGYGALVIAKTLSLVILGVMGALYRGRLLGKLEEGTQKNFTVVSRMIAAELTVMGVASGLASALARTQTPIPQIPARDFAQATPAEILTGEPLPPEFTWSKLFTLWELDLLWALIAVFAIVYYVWGHLRLATRGDHWPISRTIFWVSGMLLLIFATNSGLVVYGTYLFSIHMLGHMLLSMAVPLLLVLGAPVTLASRAIAARKDGSRGPREWILVAVHSRYLAVIGHPVVAAAIFGLSLIVFYYSPLFEWALREHLGHMWMTAHFVFSGYLFAQALIGIDPSPHNPPYPLRLIIVLATMAFHAFFGLSIILGTGLLVPEWFGAMGRTWGDSPLVDQQNGGELAWGLGEFPTLALAILVTWAWSKSDDRINKRRDRKADRDGDLELDAYNEMLKARANADRRVSRS
jgi:putative copper resistance protein D